MIQDKLLSKKELLLRVKKLKKNHLKIVFTNGCFDILHVGHVTYLEKAKQLGDILIVGINSDASIRGLKGPSRPINTLKSRSKVLAALESVDFVIPFSQETPLSLIQSVLPDVLVKGGDWKPSQIVGADIVLENEGRVRSIPFVKGHSTTKIIQRSGQSR